MYFKKMKTGVSVPQTVKISLSSTILFLSVAILMTALMANPCMAEQNDVLPSKAMAAIAKAISKDLPVSYNIEKVGEGYAAENRTHNLKMSFSHEEIRFCKANTDDSQAFTLTGIGYDTLKTPPPAEIKALENRIEFRRGRDLTEWYLNTPLGLEQGFTLHRRPDNPNKNNWLRLELTLQCPLNAVLQDDRTAVFKNSSGITVARYAGLYVTDADNWPLPARLEINNDKLILLTDDSRARYPVTIDPWIQLAKLTASDAAAGDEFGFSVAISGDTTIIGAVKDDDDGLASGSAYVFVKPVTGWNDMTQVAKLIASDAAADDYFGESVAISGDTVVVGAFRDNDGTANSGSAYVFEKGAGWTNGSANQVAKLTASDAASNDWFGVSVSISGDTAIVGAHGDDDGGSAYVFVKPASGWGDMTQTAKLIASEAAADDWFGRFVTLSNDTAIIGAHLHDHIGTDSGSAYVFVKPGGGWSDMTQTAKLTASDAGDNDRFGWHVAISGNTAIIGSRSGSTAYVFVKPGGGWSDMTQTAKLTASDTGGFAGSVAINGDAVIVGAPYDDDGGSNSGSAYAFVKPGGGWSDMTQTAKLTASDAGVNDYFGFSVAISGNTAIIGARMGNNGVVNSGSAYVFELTVIEMNLRQGAADIPNGGSHDFGSKVTGSDTDADFIIENIGSADLTLTTPLAIGGTDLGEFSIVNQPTSPVTPGGDTTFTVRFSPVSASAKTAIINIENNDNDENPYVLNLKGAGTVTVAPGPGPDPYPESVPDAGQPSAPNVINVISTASSDSYSVGSVILFTVHFSEPVWIKGMPLLVLNTGRPVPGTAYYSGGSGADMLTFRYVVADGDDISALDYWSQWALESDGGRIYSNLDIDADLDLAGPGEQGSVKYNTEIGVFGVMYPVYRFYSPILLKHLFTTDEIEKTHLIEKASEVWRFEKIAYYAYRTEQYDNASRQQKNMLQAVHRFYSETLQTHLFTIDENEKEHLIANASDVWRYEGPAFYVPASEPEGAVPVYRFYSEDLTVHLFTTDVNEKNHLIDTAGDVWQFEGIAYYAYP